MSRSRKGNKAATAAKPASRSPARAAKSDKPATTTAIARRKVKAAVAVRGSKGKLSKAQRTMLQDELGDDEFLLNKAISIAEASAEAATALVMMRYKFGTLFRDIKVKRKDKGVERVANVLGWSPSTVYDCMLLAERLPHDVVEKLAGIGTDWTMLKTIAHGETAAVRNKYVNKLLAGERLTYREVAAELQQSSGGRRSGGGRPVRVPTSVKACLAKLISTVNNTAKVVPKVSQALGPMLDALPTARITAAVREQLDAVVRATDETINDLQAERSLMATYLERFAAAEDEDDASDLAPDDETTDDTVAENTDVDDVTDDDDLDTDDDEGDIDGDDDDDDIDPIDASDTESLSDIDDEDDIDEDDDDAAPRTRHTSVRSRISRMMS